MNIHEHQAKQILKKYGAVVPEGVFALNVDELLEKVLYPSYEMKGGEHAFHCPFCNHHKKKLQVNFETQKWHCWVCNQGGHKIGILLRKINAPKNIISEVLKILGDYRGVSKDKDEKTEYNVSLPQCYQPLWKPSKSDVFVQEEPLSVDFMTLPPLIAAYCILKSEGA